MRSLYQLYLISLTCLCIPCSAWIIDTKSCGTLIPIGQPTTQMKLRQALDSAFGMVRHSSEQISTRIDNIRWIERTQLFRTMTMQRTTLITSSATCLRHRISKPSKV